MSAPGRAVCQPKCGDMKRASAARSSSQCLCVPEQLELSYCSFPPLRSDAL